MALLFNETFDAGFSSGVAFPLNISGTISATTGEQTPHWLQDDALSSTMQTAAAAAVSAATKATIASKDGTGNVSNSLPQWYESGRIQIPLYTIIFMLAVIGNTLVILTLVQNQRMRTITNLFLLNLAVSDLLLGVLCMPFTLVGALLRDFVFGEVMCKLLPFLQACSVSVGVWTLVAISVERYYAICHPLRSLRWQTISHAYKLILAIWIASLLCMMPIAILSRLKPTNQGNLKCREDWTSKEYEKVYNLFLDFVLLVIPLVVLGLTYSLITRTLCRGMKSGKAFRDNNVTSSVEVYINLQRASSASTLRWECKNQTRRQHCSWRQLRHNWSQDSNSPISCGSSRRLNSLGGSRSGREGSIISGANINGSSYLRRTNAERSLINKKRVIKMLFAVVLEFFICWTPLYVINTIALFEPAVIYNNLGYTSISFFHLLAYTSSCCNPITYCFMNCGFRKSFLNLFKCLRRYKDNNLTINASEFNMETKWANKYSEQA